MTSPAISVFIPARNEAGNIAPLFEKIARAFVALNLSGEIIFVDDGSTDATWDEANACALRFPFARLLRHRKSLGLTEAMRTGFRHCRGDVVIFLPSDLESDPEQDIPKLFATINAGYDVVAGWRQGRRDGKVLASAIANVVSRRVFGLTVHDLNWIKAFRREVIETIRLRSDWHRYILILAAAQGFTIGEVQVNYYPRVKGKTHYGFGRIPVSFLDVLVVKFLLTFSRKPMLFFGGIGLAIVLTALATFAGLTAIYLMSLGQRRPIFDFAGVMLLVGVLFFVVGFLAELIVNQNERVEELEARVNEFTAETRRKE
ncbi:MAG: glycosyltransferase family 2 protein [Chloroflexi bacterium]|nr:glycosyltransferase family 2 protein [Chloroflexota bacterium]